MEEGTFIKVYDWIIQDTTASEALCYALLLSFCKDGSKYSGGMGYLSRRLNMSRKTVKRVLTKLIEKGLVKQDTIIKNNVEYNVYWLADGDKTTPGQIDPTTVDILTLPPGQIDPTTVDILTPNNINNKDNNKENNKNNKDYSSPSTRLREEKEFDEKYFVEKFNEVLASIQNVHPVRCRRLEGLSQERKEQVEYLSEKYGDEYFWNVIIKAFQSQFLNQKESSFTYDLDWIINESRFLMIAEDKYKELHDNKPNNNGRDNIRRGVWPTPAENATRAEEWATNRILELTQPKDKGIQGEIPDNRDTDKLFLPF